MELDAAQYASLALEMLQTGNFLEVKLQGENYLDKPPLLFWTAALSYKIFGATDWAYKIPSLLFVALGIYSINGFCRLFYDLKVARLAMFIFAACQAILLITNDVRTDTMLCCSVIFASWQLGLFIQKNTLKNLLLASVGISLGLLSKGPIGLFAIIFAFGPHILATRRFSLIFKWEWILMLIIIAILLSPMCLGLYRQYGTEGLKFYFWTQSFGRITGDSSWANNPDPFFLVHSFLWSFLPWSILFFMAIGQKMFDLWKNKFQLTQSKEIITFSGIILCFLALSRSAYQLPHYIYVILPFAAIITAEYIESKLLTRIDSKFYKAVWITHLILFIVLWIVGFLLIFICFKASFALQMMYLVLVALFGYFAFYRFSEEIYKIIYMGLFTIISVNLFLSTHVYPSLLVYQSESVIGKYIRENNIKQNEIVSYNASGYITDFYAQFYVRNIKQTNELLKLSNMPSTYCFTDQNGAIFLKENGIKTDTILILKDFHITNLTLPFLKPSTRESTLRNVYLLKVK
jgi:4-amino-4-deoxy-L-arabinose transferase-like glycosyltransferase